MWTRHWIWIGIIALAGTVLAGCSAAEAPSEEAGMEPAAEMSEPVAAEAAPEPEIPATIADLFPDGEGKTLVLDNCSACHSAACSTIGQRTNARWDGLKEDHRDKASSLAEDDLETLFAYLKANFNDTQPEPHVPAHFMEGGCTPF